MRIADRARLAMFSLLYPYVERNGIAGLVVYRALPTSLVAERRL